MVTQYKLRLPESTNDIFVCSQVYTCLSSSACIDLGKECCRDKSVPQTSHINRSYHSRDVTDHTPAEAKDKSRTVRAGFKQPGAQITYDRQCLAFFSGLYGQHFCCREPVTVQSPDIRVSDYEYPLSLIHISEPTRRTPISYAV